MSERNSKDQPNTRHTPPIHYPPNYPPNRPPPPNYGRYRKYVKQNPVIGPWIGRIGMIHDIFVIPGPLVWQIWVQAAWHSLPRLLFLFEKPFVLADQFHARVGRRHGKPKGVADLIRQGLPKIDLPRGFGWRVFELSAQWALKLEWYFMIADRTTEFELNWVSLAYEYAGIRHPGDIYAGGHWSPHSPQLFTSEWVSTCIAAPVHAQGIGANGCGPFLRPGQVGAFTYTFLGAPAPDWGIQASTISTRFAVQKAGMTTYTAAKIIEPSIQGQYSSTDVYHWDGSAPGITALGVQVSGDGWGFVEEFGWEFYGHSTGTRGLLFDP